MHAMQITCGTKDMAPGFLPVGGTAAEDGWGPFGKEIGDPGKVCILSNVNYFVFSERHSCDFKSLVW